MKKILSIAMALVMMFAVCVPAFAADLNVKDTDAGDVIFTTSTQKDTDGDGVPDSDGDWYVVTIPADTTIAWGAESTELKYSAETHLLYGKTLDVDVTSVDYIMTYAPEANVALDLAFALSGDVDVNFATVTYPAVEKAISVDITADAWNHAVVGEYADTLTFSAAIV